MASTISTAAATSLAQLTGLVSKADAAALAAVGLASAVYLLREIAWDRPDPYHHLWFERPQLRDGAATARVQTTKNIAERMDELSKDVVVFWGSQSGTAEGFAKRLARECHRRFGLAAMSADLSDYDAETIQLIPASKIVIFVLSTFGEGDPSDNAAGLWEWLQNDLTAESLPNLRYAAFGLGNSSYKYYNRVVDVVIEALEKAGAKQLMPVGKADDANGGTEEAFLSWKDQLYTVFTEELGFQESYESYSPSLSVVEDSSLTPIDLFHGEPLEQRSGSLKVRNTYSPIKTLAVWKGYELCTTADVSCFHLELDLAEHPELRYRTGDHIGICPINPDEEVNLLLRALGMGKNADTPLLITPSEESTKIKLPSPTTTSALFRYYLEICAPVSRDTVCELARFAPSQEVRDLLNSLGKSKDNYAALVAKTHITLGRLLSIAAPNALWKELPLSYLLETIPLIQPRYYSISSSSTVEARRLSLTVAVEKTILSGEPQQEIRGLTSNYLLALTRSLAVTGNEAPADSAKPEYDLLGPSGLLESRKVFAYIRRSKFKLPTLGETPIIMICAGTGIAPFRGFILERARLKAIGKPVGRMLLFFGCRWPDKDYLYRDALAQLEAEMDGRLEIITAFSRADGMRKVYVQDRVAERKEEICELLDEGANLYICGRASMAREVGTVVEDSMRGCKKWSQSETQSWSESLKRGNKWLEDVWG